MQGNIYVTMSSKMCSRDYYELKLGSQNLYFEALI